MSKEKAEHEEISHEQLVAKHHELHAHVADLMKQHEVLHARVAELEKHAHSGHSIEQGALDAIAAHVMPHVDEQVRKHLGHSGHPSA